ASMSARPADPSLTSNNGRCISEYPDGEYELGNGATPPNATNCLNLCDGNFTRRPPLRAMHHVWHGRLGLEPMLLIF
ncbi:hypothetical protein PTSG_13213, partial [Salpingoeca rosetta]